jgi:hypothetical protein
MRKVELTPERIFQHSALHRQMLGEPNARAGARRIECVRVVEQQRQFHDYLIRFPFHVPNRRVGYRPRGAILQAQGLGDFVERFFTDAAIRSIGSPSG